jgi:hypothetical protein
MPHVKSQIVNISRKGVTGLTNIGNHRAALIEGGGGCAFLEYRNHLLRNHLLRNHLL